MTLREVLSVDLGANWRLRRAVPTGTLFHNMRNMPVRGTSLIAQVLRGLEERLPPGWSVARPKDAVIKVKARGAGSASVTIVARSRIGPRDVPGLIEDAGANAEAILVVSRYMSPQTRARLEDRGVSYADLTGNWRLALERPALFIQTEGASKDPAPPARSLQSLKGPAAGRVVRALCELTPPYGIRDLAARAAIPLGTLSRVVGLLDEDALVERTPRGPITSVAWRRLIDRWVEDYAVLDSNGTSSWIAPRGLPAVMRALKKSEGIAVTGSFAVNEIVATAPARLLTLYASEPDTLAESLGLMPADTGANLILLEAYDDVVFDRNWRSKGLSMVAHGQLAADLLTSPGRGPSEAQALLDWMESNEDAWRS